MSKPIILCDVDGVLYNYCGVVSGIAGIPESKFDRWKFTDNLDADEASRYQAAVAKGRLASHNLDHESPCGMTVREFISELSRIGDVVFLTAPLEGCGNWFKDRTDYLKSITDGHKVIWCSTELKHLVYGDVLIEDNLHTANRWVGLPMHGPAIVINRPWNDGPDEHWQYQVFSAMTLTSALAIAEEVINDRSKRR